MTQQEVDRVIGHLTEAADRVGRAVVYLRGESRTATTINALNRIEDELLLTVAALPAAEAVL